MTNHPALVVLALCDLCGDESPDQLHRVCSACFAETAERDREKSRPQLLTVAEAARVLNVTPRLIRRLIKTGDLPAISLAPSAKATGIRYRIRRKDLARYLSRRAITPTIAAVT